MDDMDDDMVTDLPQSESRGMRGSPESAAFFNVTLAELELTKRGLATLMKRKGDDRQPNTILRNIQRMASGDAWVSGEMRVVLYLMTRAPRRGLREKAAKAEALLEDA